MPLVLIIDDDEQIRRLVARILVGAGYEIAEADNGEKGMAIFRDRTPFAVLTDILMPEKEGLETIREIRRIDPSVRIIAMSGSVSKNQSLFLDAATAFGANAVLAKPFRANDLIRALKGDAPPT